MTRAVARAAVAWRTRVVVFSEGVEGSSAAPPCPCNGLGLVSRPVTVRGKPRFTFDPCLNPLCSASERFQGVKR